MCKPQNLPKEVIAAVMLAVAAAWTTTAWAQIPLPIGGASAVITVPGSVVSDQPVETATTDMDTVQLPPIVLSLTTGEGGQDFTPVDFGSLAQQLESISPMGDYNGWQPISTTSSFDAKTITDDTMGVYNSAYTLLNSLAANEDSSDLTAIATANNSATAVLQAIQIQTSATLALAKRVQESNEIAIINGTVATVQAAEDLNDVAGQAATEECDNDPNCVNPEQ